MAENQNIEWKESWRDEYLQWICGFANAQGGRLYIGKDDSGQMIGVSNWRKLMEDLPNIIKNSLDIVVDVNLIEDDGEKKCIEIVVPAYPMPISCKGSCYYRSGSTNQRLTGPQLESFIMSKRSISWDASPLPSFKEDDIDERVVKLFKEKATGKGRLEQNVLSEQKMELMDRLHLRNGNYLTNAAALLFSTDPEQVVPWGVYKNRILCERCGLAVSGRSERFSAGTGR